MTPLALLETAPLLGLYVLLAGGYGVAFALARLRRKPGLLFTAAGLYGAHAVAAIDILAWSPLGPGWKMLIAASSLAILAIPPIAWRYLEHTHAAEGLAHDR